MTSNISTPNSQHTLLKQSNIPFVLLDRYVDGMEYEAGVFLDNIKGTYLATDLLLRHGHRNIAFITGPMSVTTSVNRLKGYQKAFGERGLTINNNLIKEGDYLINSGYKQTEKLIKEGRAFTAIFGGNDMMAIGAMKALKNKNIKIPGDVEVIGFDNIEIAQIVEPSLTTVAQPTYDMGVLGAKLLIRLIEGEKPKTKNILLEPN